MIERLPAEPGLCGRCQHRRLLRSRRSVFLRCSLADGNPAFPRYPSLPVLDCAGFADTARAAAPPREGEDDAAGGAGPD